MRKALAISAGVLALLVALYGATGYWLAPRFVRDTLTEQAARHGIQLRVETVRTDPFTLTVAVEGVYLRASGEQEYEFATARRASVDLAWASLWKWQWVLDEIRLEAPWVDVGRLPPVDAKAGDGELPAIVIREVTVVDGTAPLGAYGLTLRGLNANAQNLSTRSKERGRYAIATRVEGGGEVSSSGSVSLAPISAQGNIEASTIPISLVWQPVQGTIHATAQYAYEKGRLVLRQAAIDGNGIGYAATKVSQLQVTAAGLAIPSAAPFEVTAKASVVPEGRLTAQGEVSLQPLQAELQIEAANLPLTDLQPWLPDHVNAKLVSGSLSGNGKLRLARTGAEPTVGYEGAASVRDMRVEEGDSGHLLVAWNLAESTMLRAESHPLGVEADELLVRGPEGRLIIEKDGSVNFVTAFAGGEKTDEPGGPRQITIDRTRLENGTLHFADRSLENPFQVVMRELAGSIVGFSTEGGDPARVQLAGRVESYGSARVQGTVNLHAPSSLAQFVANFRNLSLAEFNPYVVKFSGYRIESGRLSAELRYQLRDGRLEGKNQLVFEQIQLGEKIESAKLDLPLELAVALLADRHGRIDLDIPVSGNLQNPQFDFGAIIAQAFRNAVRSIVTAPFRALSSLLGGGRDRTPGEVHFDPGAVALAPPEEEHITRLANALEERPQLAVLVRGSYEPERDLAALRERAVRREIAARAGGEPGDGGEGIDFGNPQLMQVAERMYLERVGNRLELQQLREREPQYGRALLRKLAHTVPVDEAELQSLARARAEVVRAALVTRGVESSRVRIAPAVQQSADTSGVATTLTLTPERSAAARATGD